MYEKGLSLEFVDASFISSESKTLNLVDAKKNNNSNLCTVVFGRNGSGKTTICKSIESVINQQDIGYQVKLLDSQNNEFNSNQLENIRIFSERFVDENIRFKEKGLDTIILLGEDVDVDDQIKIIEEKLEGIEKDINLINIEQYDNPTNEKCPFYHMERMKSTLKQPDNWASRQKKIKQLQRNASVNDREVEQIKNDHSKKISIEKFNKLLEEYLDAKKNNLIYDKMLELPEKADMERIIDILHTQVPRKSDDTIAEEIYTVIANYGESRLNEIKVEFESNTNICPYCFRPINQNEKDKVVSTIKRVLSKETDGIKEKINSLVINEYSINNLPEIVDKGLELKLHKCREQYNSEVNIINGYLHKKLEDVYSFLDVNADNYLNTYEQLTKVIEEINSNIQSHNKKVQESNKLREDLEKYNNSLSWESIKEDYKKYEDQCELKEKAKVRYKDLNKKRNDCNQKLLKLRTQKNNSKLAVEEINKLLSFVFLSKDRLSIIVDNDVYKVFSNGKSINLKDLSTGERNIIALCYFFSYIGKEKDIDKRFDDEYLIIIDDPITSFDHENKVGIYSLLRNMISCILAGNRNSRFMFLSHGYDVAYNLDKIFNDINKELKIGNKENICSGKQLENFCVEDCDLHAGKNQYKLLVDKVYSYAIEDETDANDINVGNMIRRVMEMFSTFVFNSSFERLNKQITQKSELYELLKNYMFRVVANNESHLMLDAYSIEQIDRFETFTHEEKVNTAKICLLLLNELAQDHLKAYLEDKVSNVEQWKNEISKILGNI